MEKIIKIFPPVFESFINKKEIKRKIKIRIEANSGEFTYVDIDFSNLISFAGKVNTIVVDFFLISSCIYCIDRLFERRKNSVDGWSREFIIQIPVTDPVKWGSLSNKLESILSFLTGDYWKCSFYQNSFVFPLVELDQNYDQNFKQVNLFSGGLDSLIGAIDFLEEFAEENLLLVSHYDQNMHGPKNDQEKVIDKLVLKYNQRIKQIPSINIHPTIANETTCRSRSLLFLGLATLISQTKGLPIIVPENGTVSLNFPLSTSRRSACSTRTTHPTFISKITSLLLSLDLIIDISNPYKFDTKGEMVSKCNNTTFLKQIIDLSNSCGKRGHRSHWIDDKRASHCGTCMPCVYRRASLLTLTDKTTYGTKLDSLYPFKTDKGQDIGACLEYLKKPITFEEIKNELIVNGLIDLPNLEEYAKVVMRTRDELKAWVMKFGNINVRRKAGL